MAKILKYTPSAISFLVDKLRAGSIVSFPTETVYALACDPYNDKAVAELYGLKQRNSGKPLSLLVRDLAQMKNYVHIDAMAEKFIAKFSPGPMTYVLNKKNNNGLSELINTADSTLGVRIPDCAIAQEILNVFGGPIIGTSTNFSGENSAVDVVGVNPDLLAAIEIVIDGGRTKYSNGSTVVDLTNPAQIKVLRKGVIDLAE